MVDHLMVWCLFLEISIFDSILVTQKCVQVQRHTGVLPFEMLCATDFLLFSFIHRIAVAKKICQQTLHYPLRLLPRTFSWVVLLFPLVLTFPSFSFFSPQYLGHNFNSDFYYGYMLPKLAFYIMK